MLVRRLALTLLFVAATASVLPAATIPPDPCANAQTDVCGVSHFRTNPDQKLDQASLGDSIVITLKDAVYSKIVPAAQAGTNKITLYLNGRDSDLTPDIYNDATNQLTFRLERNSDNKSVWMALLRDPYKSPHRSVLVTIGV
ncbi:MAG: hypothetical protein ACRD9W_25825, partial [Terriglobia bacterium]